MVQYLHTVTCLDGDEKLLFEMHIPHVPMYLSGIDTFTGNGSSSISSQDLYPFKVKVGISWEIFWHVSLELYAIYGTYINTYSFD